MRISGRPTPPSHFPQPARPSCPCSTTPPTPGAPGQRRGGGMPLLVAGLLGGWLVMGVGGVVFLGLLVGLWLWAGSMDKKQRSDKKLRTVQVPTFQFSQ